MLLRNRNSAIPQSQFFMKSATSSPQLESFNSAIFGTFSAVEFGRFMRKKSEVKNLVLLSVLLRQVFGFQRNRGFYKYFFLLLKPAWAEEKGQVSSGLAGDCGKLRNCGSQIFKVRNHSSATFFSPQLRNRFGCPQYCGVAEVRTYIADAQLYWFVPMKSCEITKNAHSKQNTKYIPL